MRLSTPVRGTPPSSRVPSASLPKSTSAWKGDMSPVASALPCARSRHHAGLASTSGLATLGSGSAKRKAALKKAVAPGPPPPGAVAVRDTCGTR
jgi:hypothetical protein